MDHLAIMSPSRHFIEKILSGEKTIESRWYKNRIVPWNKIKPGETVYFKNAGKMVTAKAVVGKVDQFSISSVEEGLSIAKKFQQAIWLSPEALRDTNWLQNKFYVILIHLQKPMSVVPFQINKKGYGSACAWITLPDIQAITTGQ